MKIKGKKQFNSLNIKYIKVTIFSTKDAVFVIKIAKCKKCAKTDGTSYRVGWADYWEKMMALLPDEDAMKKLLSEPPRRSRAAADYAGARAHGTGRSGTGG